MLRLAHTGPVVCLALAASGLAAAQPVAYLDPQFDVEVSPAIVYGQGAVDPASPGTIDLLLDLYRPVGPGVPSPAPAFLLIHGGGFTGGSRSQSELVQIAQGLASRGYAVASIDYRVSGDLPILAPEYAAMLADASDPSHPLALPAVAGVEDAAAAYRWLVENAATWELDTSRIAVGGGSAGAIIAVELAIALDDHGISEVPSLRCVIDLWGMAWPLPASDLESGEPPIFSVHGELDTRVPFSQAVALRDRALEVGVPFEFHPIAGAGHGFQSIDFFGLEVVPGVTLFDRSVQFLRLHQGLAPPPATAVPALSPLAAGALVLALACCARRKRSGGPGAAC